MKKRKTLQRKPMDGLLLFNKPIFWTSHDAVDFVRRLSGQRSVGHAGTLDPMATGLLLILLGRWTKKSEELMGLEKDYEGTILFGIHTDSYDLDGRVLKSEVVCGLTCDRVGEAFASLTGTISQLPPAFSAIKTNGKKSYELARRGIAFDRKPREVTVSDFRCIRLVEDEAYFFVNCSKGTYVRSLAYDAGKKLNVAATLSSLVRTRIGPYHLREAVDILNLPNAEKKIQSELLFENLSHR